MAAGKARPTASIEEDGRVQGPTVAPTVGRSTTPLGLGAIPGDLGGEAKKHEVEAKADEVRRLAGGLRLAQERLERVQAEVRWRRARAAPISYLGLHGEINAFLDMQALSVASLASEELRRRPSRTCFGSPAD
ncbi:MAG: hypothetical protein ACREC5_07875 [Thermoplasmata archaeon]